MRLKQETVMSSSSLCYNSNVDYSAMNLNLNSDSLLSNSFSSSVTQHETSGIY